MGKEDKGILEILVGENHKRDPFKDLIGFTNIIQDYNFNTSIQFNKTFQYEFINLGNVPVSINGRFIDRYYSGVIPNPTYLGSDYKWAPIMKAGERDTTSYAIIFLDTYWGAVSVQRRLQVVRKVYSPPSVPGQM